MKRMRVTLRLLAAATLVAPAAVLAQERQAVPVRVVDIAGPYAYLSAGSARGLRAGTRVRVSGVERLVLGTTSSFSVVASARLRVGDRGVAQARPADAPDASRRAPRPLAAFEGQWPEVERPSSRQAVEAVPLGRMVPSDTKQRARVRGMLSASSMSMVPLSGESGVAGHAELRGRFEMTPRPDHPQRVVADVALQRWFGRFTTGVAGGDARPLVRVRELSLELGKLTGARAELGRLRYASIHLGPLDGARFEAASLGPLRVSAFGGLLANPISGRAEWGAGRFGMELELADKARALRPALAVALQGSVFAGRVDERRVYARAQLWPGKLRLAAYAEGALFERQNPWGRPPLDLTQAGVDLDLQFDHGRLGGRFDMRKPERSNWLASYLPTTWLCADSSALDASTACGGRDDTRYVAQVFGGASAGGLLLDVGGSYAASSQRDLGRHALGYGTLRLPRMRGRYDLAVGGSHEGGSLLRASSALRGEVGIAWLDDRVRLDLYYRPAHQRYRASLASLWEQGFGGSLRMSPAPTVSIDLRADARLGFVDALVVMAMLGYRVGA